MSGRHCPRCKDYMRDHAANGDCQPSDHLEACTAQWEARIVEQASIQLREIVVGYLKRRDLADEGKL